MRRAIALILLALAAAALSPVPAGHAADRPAKPSRTRAGPFTFYGSGFGHGIGMSQWGAYGLSLEGWNSERILTHFYTDTRVGRATDPPGFLRVGPVQGSRKIRLTAEAGQVDLLVGHQSNGELVGTIPNGETWTVEAVGDQYRVVDAAGNHVGGDLLGGVDSHLYAAYEQNSARVKVQESGGHTYNRGYLEFNLYSCGGPCDLRLIIVLDPEAYLYGIGEVPSSWPKDALETQAVAARTYAFTKAAVSQHRSLCNCALLATAADQVYVGWDKEGGPDGNRWVNAVDATTNRVVTHDGVLIQAFYSASSGGYTENNENVWGGEAIPYLRGVCDPGDYTLANTSSVWEVSMSAGAVTNRLALGIGTVKGFSSIQRGVSGRIVTMNVEGSSGSANISGVTLRASLGLRDDRVWINADRSVTGEIRQKYDSLNCSPGLPTSSERTIAGGLRQKFTQAQIYFRDGLGAHELWGFMLDHYLAQGGPSGSLGFPTTDVKQKPNGGTAATFEHGTVTCSPLGSCKSH